MTPAHVQFEEDALFDAMAQLKLPPPSVIPEQPLASAQGEHLE